MKHSTLLRNWAESLGTMPAKSSWTARAYRTFPLAITALSLTAAAIFLTLTGIIVTRSWAIPVRSDLHKKTPRPRATPAPVALPASLAIPSYARGPRPFSSNETFVYEASWEGIPAAQAQMTMVHNSSHPDRWTGQMWITSSPLVDHLYRMRDYFREDFDYASWQPVEINILQHDNQRKDHWQATFDHPNQLITAIKTNQAGRTWIRRFTGGDPWGPFSGAMMALSQPLAPGGHYTFDVFSGGNRYVFAFAVQGRERITIGLGTFKTLRIEPSVVWLSEGSFRKDAAATTIWVTDDSRHLPIRIESAVFIGSVVAELTEVKGAPESPPS